MDLIVLIGGILGLLVFLIMTVLSFWSWRWFHPVAMALVMFATVAFVAYGAQVTKTRLAWQGQYDKFRKNLMTAEGRLAQLETGVDATGNKVNPTLGDLESEVIALSYDRGRAWRGSIPQEVALPNVKLQLNRTAAPDAAAAAAVNPLPQNMIVYLFKETTTPQGWKLPYFYLGEWRVAESDGTAITLETTGVLDGAQVRQLNDRADPTGQPATWAVFEMMPVDNRELLSEPGYVAEALAAQFPITPEALQLALPKALYGPALTDEQYQATIAKLSQQMKIDYLYDGKPVVEIQKEFPDFDPEDSAIYIEVKFTKEKTFEVDADQATNPIDRPAYNTEGQAVVPGLQQAGPVTFEEGDVAVFPKELAEQVIAEGVVDPNYEATAVTYRRPLRDYAFLFSDNLFLLDQLEESIANAQQKAAELNNAIVKLQGDRATPGGGQIGLRTEERTKLQADLASVRKELEVITQYHQELTTRWTEKKKLLSTLYRSNQEFLTELRRLQEEQAERINSRTISVQP